MIKRIIVLTIVMSIHPALWAQHRLEKVWETDTVTLRNPESVLYDPLSNSIYVSCMGAGKIVRLQTNGTVLKDNWVTGLTLNKGCALYNGFFYTAEPAAVAVIDVKTGTVIKRIPVDGAVMLNDVAMDANGIIYVTDTRAGKVYRIEGDNAALYLENLPGANGLLTVNTDLYVLTSTSVEKVDAQKGITKIADGFESGLDGIVMVSENEFILSNYKGLLYYLEADGTKQLLLDTRPIGIMSNDISYDPQTKMLYVPSYSSSRVTAYNVK